MSATWAPEAGLHRVADGGGSVGRVGPGARRARESTQPPGYGGEMSATRLSPLDASFLTVETPSAHMHLGWAAAFEQPADVARPRFEDLRGHIASRLARAPRY